MRLCGISSHFWLLSPSIRQVTHALLTRPPLEIDQIHRSLNEIFPVRLACVKHAASVHPEPGSNSHNKFNSVRTALASCSEEVFVLRCLPCFKVMFVSEIFLDSSSRNHFKNPLEFSGLFYCSVIKELVHSSPC